VYLIKNGKKWCISKKIKKFFVDLKHVWWYTRIKWTKRIKENKNAD